MVYSTAAAFAIDRRKRLIVVFRELFEEYGATSLTECAVALSLLLTYKLAAHGLGKAGFSEYAIARRTISLLFPFLLVGLPVALPRYIGHASGDIGRCTRYYGATLRCQACLACLVGAVILLFRRQFAYLFFGSADYTNLAFPVLLVLLGLSLHAVVYNYFRGKLDLKAANVLQFVNFALVPMAAFYRFGTTIQGVLTAWGAGTLAIAAAGLLFTPWRGAVMSQSWMEAKELLRYGVPRLPGGFAMLGLMSLPATFTVHLRGVEEGGFVAFSTSLLNLIGSIFTPVGVVLLPRASQLCADGDYVALRAQVLRVVKLAIIVAVGFTLAFEFFANELIRGYLGQDYSEVVVLTRIIVLGALPFALYYVLQPLIDAHHTRPVNALNCISSLAVFLVACGPALVFRPETVIPWAFVAGILSLGILTIREAKRVFRAARNPVSGLAQ